MGVLGKLWDDIAAGPAPSDHTYTRPRRRRPKASEDEERRRMVDREVNSESAPANPFPPALRSVPLERDGSAPIASPGGRDGQNVWHGVFHPGRNNAMKKIGSQKFDKAEPNSPTVYDWLYSEETKATRR